MTTPAVTRPLRRAPTNQPVRGAAPGVAAQAPSRTQLVLPVRSARLFGGAATPDATRATPGAPDPSVPSATGQLPGLDGLRAIAVAAVIAYHLGELPGGFLGVDVFFVVSGFLITRLLLAEQHRAGAISLRAFWVRRFRRLVPALLVVIAATAIASRAWLPRYRWHDIRGDGVAALTYVANWRFTLSDQSYFASGSAPSPLRHMWSLAVEEQFYVLWPILVVGAIALARHRPRVAVSVLAGVGTVSSAVWMAVSSAQGDLSRSYYGTDTRVFALCAGAWLSTWWDEHIHRLPDPRRRERRRVVVRRAACCTSAALGLFFVFAPEDAGWFYRYGFQATAALAVVTVAGVATGGGLSGRFFANPVLGWLGHRSYGIYLWSWPVQVLAAEHFRLGRLPLAATVVSCSLALAALSYWLVEQPVRLQRAPAGLAGRRMGAPRRTRPSPIRPRFAAAGVSIAVVVVIVMTSAWGGTAAPSYLRSSDRQALAGALAPPVSGAARRPVMTRPAESTDGSTPVSPPGPLAVSSSQLVDPNASVPPEAVRGRTLHVLVTGDSVGWTLAWQQDGRVTSDITIDDRAIIACGILPGTGSFIVGDMPAEQYPESCQEATRAEQLGLSAGPDVVLLTIGAWEVYDQEYWGRRHDVGDRDYGRYLEQQVQGRIDTYKTYGVPTVLALLPCYGRGAARLGTEREDPKRVAWVNARLRAVAARNVGWVAMVDPRAQLCTPSDQPLTKTPTGLTLREDGVHFNEQSAAWFWDSWLAGQLGAALQGSMPPTQVLAVNITSSTPVTPTTAPTPAPTGP